MRNMVVSLQFGLDTCCNSGTIPDIRTFSSFRKTPGKGLSKSWVLFHSNKKHPMLGAFYCLVFAVIGG